MVSMWLISTAQATIHYYISHRNLNLLPWGNRYRTQLCHTPWLQYEGKFLPTDNAFKLRSLNWFTFKFGQAIRREQPYEYMNMCTPLLLQRSPHHLVNHWWNQIQLYCLTQKLKCRPACGLLHIAPLSWASGNKNEAQLASIADQCHDTCVQKLQQESELRKHVTFWYPNCVLPVWFVGIPGRGNIRIWVDEKMSQNVTQQSCHRKKKLQAIRSVP